MAQGVEMENIGNTLREFILTRRHLTVVVSMINPEAAFIPVLADHLGLTEEHVRQRITASLAVMHATKAGLPIEEQHRIHVLVSDALPVASYIMIDVDEPDGRIQLDIKPYKLPRQSSFTIEFRGPETYLYGTLRTTALQILANARPYMPRLDALPVGPTDGPV